MTADAPRARRSAVGRTRTAEVAVDRIACAGRGLCAAVLPERITLDEWGYPVIDRTPADRAAAREAARICPVRALYLREPPAEDRTAAVGSKAVSSGR